MCLVRVAGVAALVRALLIFLNPGHPANQAYFSRVLTNAATTLIPTSNMRSG